MKDLKSLENDLKKRLALNKITGNLGKVVETENEIICYVKQTNLPKKWEYLFLYPSNYGKNKSIAKEYNINKTIHYIFDGLKICNSIDVYSNTIDGVKITFKNCKFKGYHTHIVGCSNCNIINCDFSQTLHTNINAYNISIKSTMLSEFCEEYSFCAANNLSLDNVSTRKSTYVIPKKITLYAKDDKINSINLLNTNLLCRKLIVDSSKINSSNSKLKARDEITIFGDIMNNLETEAPKVIAKSNSKVELDSKRIELIDSLKKIKSKCEELNNAELQRIENKVKKELNTKTLTKVFKK